MEFLINDIILSDIKEISDRIDSKIPGRAKKTTMPHPFQLLATELFNLLGTVYKTKIAFSHDCDIF